VIEGLLVSVLSVSDKSDRAVR